MPGTGIMIVPRGKDDSQPLSRMSYELHAKGAEFRSGGPLRPGLANFPADIATEKRIGSISFLRLHNPPLAVAEMIEEVNHATPKQVIFLDSRPVLHHGAPGANNWCDPWSCPNAVLIFLNPETATPAVVAHELNHAWIFFILGYEDRRQFFDPRHKQMDFLVNYVQSAVIDCKVLQQLQWRQGLDLPEFRYDMVAVAVSLVKPLGHGQRHFYDYSNLITACSVAVPRAFPELYELDHSQRETIRGLMKILWRFEPKLARTTERMTEAMKMHGFDTPAGAIRAIDECLAAAVSYLGAHDFDPRKHLIPRVMQMEWRDKLRNFNPGAPVELKHRILRESIRRRQHPVNPVNRPNERDVAVQWAPMGAPFSALDLPEIVRPAPAYPAEYSREPIDSIEKVLAHNLERMRFLNAEPGRDIIQLNEDVNIYEKNYVFSEDKEASGTGLSVA